jgi:hypothetical protein
MSKDKDIDINDVSFVIELESDVIEKVRKGDITRLMMDIGEDNQNFLLESVDGHLILITDETPTTYHGCYLYNNGVFPYVIKNSLHFLVLSDGKDNCLVRIIGEDVEQGIHFNYKGAGQPIEEDPNGDSCVWEVQFDILPIPPDAKTYLMRWNPSISSFTEMDYEACVANMQDAMFFMNWSIREWEEARRGDFFYMMRMGDDKAGIVFNGQFISDPYPGDDWAGSTKRRMYVDIVCTNPVKPGEVPLVSLNMLQKTIPSIEWGRGSSGILLPEEVKDALDDLWNEG